METNIVAGLVAVVLLAVNGFAEKPERSVGEELLRGWPTNALESIDYGLLLEVEGFGSKIGGENESDVAVATVAFDLEMRATEWMLGHVGLLWEEDSREDDNVDEAFMALGAVEGVPYYLVAGRFYQPVGNFETAFISDPMTLELMEMNQTAGMAGYANAWIDIGGGAFRGDTKEGAAPGDGGDDTISDFFASVAVTPVAQLVFGAYWLSDLMETYNYGMIGEDVADQPGYEKQGAAGAFANLALGRVAINAECAGALDAYNLGGGRYQPLAYNLEASAEVADRWTVGLKYEGSDDLFAAYDRTLLQYGDKLPGAAYGVVVSHGFHENATVAVEYLHLDDLENGDSGDLVTVQLALEI